MMKSLRLTLFDGKSVVAETKRSRSQFMKNGSAASGGTVATLLGEPVAVVTDVVPLRRGNVQKLKTTGRYELILPSL